jgi:RNA 3'-terminal phosphate cyclase
MLQVPPQNANRMVDAARGVLNQLLADVYIFTDAAAGPAAGNSPGYGITLVGETTSGCLISAEAAATTVRPSNEAAVIGLLRSLRCCCSSSSGMADLSVGAAAAVMAHAIRGATSPLACCTCLLVISISMFPIKP